jgi:hypothetical protein
LGFEITLGRRVEIPLGSDVGVTPDGRVLVSGAAIMVVGSQVVSVLVAVGMIETGGIVVGVTATSLVGVMEVVVGVATALVVPTTAVVALVNSLVEVGKVVSVEIKVTLLDTLAGVEIGV